MKTAPSDSAVRKYSRLLKDSPLFRDMSDEELAAAAGILTARYTQYDKGEFLHRSYTPMTMFGMVTSGVVQACVDDMEGNRMILAEVVPGVTFGESLCFLGEQGSPVYVFASEPAEVLWFSAAALFRDGADAFTLKLQRQFTAMLAQRTLAMNDRIQVLSKIRLRDKMTAYFSQMSLKARSLTFQLPLNRDDLATYMGINRSALSRELAQMKKEGLIDYYRNTIRILK